MSPFSIANAVVGAENDENGRQCAFSVQIVPVEMTRFGEICSIVQPRFARFYVARSKKQGIFTPYRRRCAIEIMSGHHYWSGK